FERLYLHFISTNILTTRDLNRFVISNVNGMRYLVNYSIANISEFSLNTMERMADAWRRAEFSRFSVNEWLYGELRHLYPDLNFPQNITLGNNAFEFFNQNIISDIRNLDVIN
ncbi:hypothetical protein PSI15_12790, partial [Xenorhabdus sp. PR6a]|uniref:hypothetical protein n=1 Tax=Xenorhabdus sp. PR6a TaxID=3025877 RepID=UPI002358B0B6